MDRHDARGHASPRSPPPATVWTALTVAQWYGRGERAVEVASATAVWYHSGQPTVPLRWVLIRDPQQKFTTQHERRRRVVFIIDEAHLLAPDQLEELRLLTNAEMDSQSPFALLLVGQPTLARQLRLGVFAALDQRVATRYQLAPMDLAESAQYLRHHLTLVGRTDPLFADDAIARLHKASLGLPRALNNAAIAALIAAATAGKALVDDDCAKKGRRGTHPRLMPVFAWLQCARGINLPRKHHALATAAIARTAACSVLLAAALSLVLSRGASVPVGILLFVLLTVVGFVALTIAPDAIALQRRHYWRWWWRSSEDDGPFWPGTRIPRGPRRPP